MCEQMTFLRKSAATAVAPIYAFLKTAAFVVCCGAMQVSCSSGDRTTEPSTQTKETTTMTIYDFTAKGRNGTSLDLASLKGRVLLVVNTATGCVFTPQYEG